jgi:hypothetical protein
MATGVNFVVREVDLRVRPVDLRLPFRFGASTLTGCPQLFARVDIEVPGHGRAQGYSAELMVPKWFDKRPGFSTDDNIAHLASAARHAARAYLEDAPATPFGLFARHYPELMARGRADGQTELSTAFGQALLDKAIVDALCAALGVSFFDAAHRNAFGLSDSPVAPDLQGWDWPAWLATLRPLREIEARHTIGLLDELDAVRYDAHDLPVSLRAVIERHGHLSFKVKLGGDPDADLVRLREVLAVLDATAGDYRYTLDGNEQYGSVDALQALLAGLVGVNSPLYIEQPLPREASFDAPLPDGPAPFLMDEADGTLGAFPQGRMLGWSGVSSKSCKGLYKSLINRARCDKWNLEDTAERGPSYFMSAEDLTCQAGLAVQQDLALVALLGITHSERNGHHYGHGFGTAPMAEQQAFAAAHPDLYEVRDGVARLRIERGLLPIDSLFNGGSHARGAAPDWEATQPLPTTGTL